MQDAIRTAPRSIPQPSDLLLAPLFAVDYWASHLQPDTVWVWIFEFSAWAPWANLEPRLRALFARWTSSNAQLSAESNAPLYVELSRFSWRPFE